MFNKLIFDKCNCINTCVRFNIKNNMKAYISKVNDRNLQRKRESGITTYVLYSISGLICWKIFEIYPNINFSNKIWETFEVALYTLNIALMILSIYLMYAVTIEQTSSTKLKKISLESRNLLEDIISYGAYFSIIALHLIFSVVCFILSDDVYFYNIISFLGLTVFAYFLLKKDKDEEVIYKLQDGVNKGNSTMVNKIELIIYSTSIIIIITTLSLILHSDLSINKLNVFIFTSLIALQTIIALIILNLKKEDSTHKALEDLEFEINVKDLNDEQIKLKLQENYYGFLLSEWTKSHLEKFKKHSKSFYSSIEKIKVQEEGLLQVDKTQYPMEFEGREKNILKLKEDTLDKFDKELKAIIKEIVNIIKKGSLSKEEEEEILMFYVSVVTEVKPKLIEEVYPEYNIPIHLKKKK